MNIKNHTPMTIYGNNYRHDANTIATISSQCAAAIRLGSVWFDLLES